MIEIRFKYLNKIKFEKYARELLVKYNISPDLVELNYEHCRLIIDAEEEDVKELIKDRLVLMAQETKGKKKK